MINLSAPNLFKSYKKRKVMDSVSLDVKKGEIVELLGPNGAGKTTTFYMIMGIVRPESGKVFCDNVEVKDYPMNKRANMGIVYIAHETSIFRNLKGEEN